MPRAIPGFFCTQPDHNNFSLQFLAAQIPNTPLRELPGGPAGVTCLAFSAGGTYLALAAACGPTAPGPGGSDSFKLCIYKTLTGGWRLERGGATCAG